MDIKRTNYTDREKDTFTIVDIKRGEIDSLVEALEGIVINKNTWNKRPYNKLLNSLYLAQSEES